MVLCVKLNNTKNNSFVDILMSFGLFWLNKLKLLLNIKNYKKLKCNDLLNYFIMYYKEYF